MEAGRSRGPVALRQAALTRTDQRIGENKSGWFNIAAALQLNPNHTDEVMTEEEGGERQREKD